LVPMGMAVDEMTHPLKQHLGNLRLQAHPGWGEGAGGWRGLTLREAVVRHRVPELAAVVDVSRPQGHGCRQSRAASPESTRYSLRLPRSRPFRRIAADSGVGGGPSAGSVNRGGEWGGFFPSHRAQGSAARLSWGKTPRFRWKTGAKWGNPRLISSADQPRSHETQAETRRARCPIRAD
jgi:hypothetical protein